MNAHPELVEHSQEFRKEIIRLAPEVYTAVGYAASNVHMLAGDDAVVIIDTTESTAAAENIRAEFRKITDKPVETIIYTHSHRDHISGATVFAEGGAPEVIASHLFRSDLVAVDAARPQPLAALMARTRRQFGIGLSFPQERVNLGLGPGDRPLKGLGEGHIPPTRLIAEDRVRIVRAGFTLDLVHAPGETADHLVVWLDDRKVLFSGDNYYHSFPNLYAIRGTGYRDFDAWADSLDLLLGFGAGVLAPGHSRPVFGAPDIAARLTDYRDAIRHIVRDSVAAMNDGLGWDDVVARVKLPTDLAAKPWLREFYGKVSWSVRAYCTGTLGWFDGNPTNLDRLAPEAEAERWVALCGGADVLMNAAQAASVAQDHQWALELCDRLLALDADNADARMLKSASLRALAETEINATARNTYLLYARELDAGDV